jgi:lipopolysaccharide transport system permease protein
MSTSEPRTLAQRAGVGRRPRRLLSPATLAFNLYHHRRLIAQFAWRDVVMRYKGSYLGLVWSFVVPLLMLAVYGFVFGALISVRWPGAEGDSKLDFALILFGGLLAFNVFADVVSRAPTMITSYPSYVKKVVFPLEVLPVAALGTALVNAAVGFVILLPIWAIAGHSVSSTIWLLPVALVPLCFLTLGMAWLLASLGVFVRDIAHPVTVIVQMLLFASGVFFAISLLPESAQRILLLNPLVTIIENVRRTALWGEPIHWRPWLIATIAAAVLMQLGFAWFMRSKRAFADVL